MRSLIAPKVEKCYGRLEVRYIYHNGRWMAHCVCSCVKKTIVETRVEHLQKGFVVSCGCFSEEYKTTHGLLKGKRTGDRYYRCWEGIKYRCYNKNSRAFKYYGGRGIRMYEAWIEDAKAFVDYVKQLPGSEDLSLTLDRKDNNGHYEPGNLRWATWSEQINNRRAW